MFPRRNRLKRQDFPRMLAGGRRVSSDHFSAIIPTASLGGQVQGYAVVVPKKIARLSVSRHHIKRQVIEALLSLAPLPDSLIIFPKASALRLDALHTRADLAKLLVNTSTGSSHGRFGSK